MKKARIILTVIVLCSVLGGLLAFKAKFTPWQVWTTTTAVYIIENGIVYATYGNFCTTINKYVTTTGVLSPIWYLSYYTTTTRTLTATNGSGWTITAEFVPCLPMNTFTTNAW